MGAGKGWEGEENEGERGKRERKVTCHFCEQHREGAKKSRD